MTEDETKTLKRKLYSEADRAGLTGQRRDAYVYASLRRAGWKPSKKPKGVPRG